MDATRRKIEYWHIRAELVKATEEHYRNKIYSRIRDLSSMEKVKVVTFDGVAPYITPEKVIRLLSFLNTRIYKNIFDGVGIEVGSGSGFFASVLAGMPNVNKIFAVEISRPIVENIAPEIVKFVAGDQSNKVVLCVGDFSHMEIASASVNFVFDFFSLHHSDNLDVTFSEMARVLRPGGKIICLDKARSNNLTDEDLEKLLDKEYSQEMKEFMGVDPDTKWTRRMNGEREFRLKDWQEFGERAGVPMVFHTHLSMTKSRNFVIRLIKSLLSILPVRFEMLLTRIFGLAGRSHPNHLATDNLLYTSEINDFPKEISLMIFSK